MKKETLQSRFNRILAEETKQQLKLEAELPALKRLLAYDIKDYVNPSEEHDITKYYIDSERKPGFRDSVETIKEKYKTPKRTKLVEEFHPDVVEVAEAPFEGGVMENLDQQHAWTLDRVNKTPMGFGMYSIASVMEDFVEAATQLEMMGLSDAAAIVDNAADELLTSVAQFNREAAGERRTEAPELIMPEESHGVADAAKPVSGTAATSAPEHEVASEEPHPGEGSAHIPEASPSAAEQAEKVVEVGANAAFAGSALKHIISKNPAAEAAVSNIAAEAEAVGGAAATASNGGRLAGMLAKVAPAAAAVGGALAMPAVWIPLVAAVAGVAFYKLYTATMQETLAEDINDMREDIQGFMSSDYTPAAKQYLTDALAQLNNISALKATIDNKPPVDIAGETFVKIQDATKKLQGDMTMFKQEAGTGIIRGLFGFPTLEKHLQDVIADINTFFQAFASTVGNQVAQLNKVINQGHGGDASGTPSPETPARATYTPEHAAQERLRGVQSWLARHGDEDLNTDGKMDPRTEQAIENFVRRFNARTGATNLTVNRIIDEGDEHTMRALQDIYDNAASIAQVMPK